MQPATIYIYIYIYILASTNLCDKHPILRTNVTATCKIHKVLIIFIIWLYVYLNLRISSLILLEP